MFKIFNGKTSQYLQINHRDITFDTFEKAFTFLNFHMINQIDYCVIGG